MGTFKLPTIEEIEAANRKAEESTHEPRAVGFTLGAGGSLLSIHLNQGLSLVFYVSSIPELAGATLEELSHLELTPSGTALSCRPLDVDISIEGLVLGALGDRGWQPAMQSYINRRIASSTSARKKASSAANGRNGGRPRKTVSSG